MSGNWLRTSIIGLGMVLTLPGALMAQSSATLDTLVVTATRAEESKREVASNVTVVTEQEIKSSTAQNMAQLLTQMGFQVVNQGTQKILKIRGMGQNSMGTEMDSNALVLLNGRRIGSNNVGLMGLANIERVEIIRGPSAVQYGPSAMGGVVNIITRRGTEDIQAGLEVGLGSFGLNKQAANLSGAMDSFDFSAAVTRTHTGNYDISGGDAWKHTSTDSIISSNLDMGYTFLDTHRLGLNFNYYEEGDARSPGGGWTQTGAINNTADYGNYDLRNYNMAFSYEGETEDERFNWMARYSFGQDASIRRSFSSIYGPSWGDNILHNKAAAGQFGYNGDILSLMMGLDYIKYEYDQKGSYSNQVSEHEDTAVYLAGKLRFFEEKLILSAGGRYDWYDLSSTNTLPASDKHFTPSLGLAYLPAEWVKFRANYAEGFKMPTPTQLGGDGGGYYVPSSGLNPESSKTYELGVDVDWEYLSGSLTYFHTDWNDKIIALAKGGGKYQYTNIDAARIAGLEFSLNADLGEAFDWGVELTPYMNLTYLLSRKNKEQSMITTVGSDTLPNTPKMTISYGLAYADPRYDFTARLNATYFGSTRTADYREGAPAWPNTQYVTQESSTVVDLSMEKKLFDFSDKGALSLRGEVNNIFDGDNERYLDYPDPGRNFYLGLKYTY